jgi:low temperature requirement protein LtrA
MLPISRLDPTEHRTSWLELFYDLVFVAAVSQLGTNLGKTLSPMGWWAFVAMFVPVWWCWSGSTNFASRYQLPELTNRLLTLVELLAVALMAASIGDVFAGAYHGFVWAYAVVRLILIGKYAVVVKQHANLRKGVGRLVVGFILGLGCWLLSLGWPVYKEWLWLLSFALDLACVIFSGPYLKAILPNSAHLPERFGLFTLIVLGESVVAVVNTLQPLHVGPAGAVRGIISLMIAFALWWLYFDGLNDTVIRIAQIHRRVGALNGWIFCHLLLFLGLSVMSVGVRLMIPAPDTMFTGIMLVGSTLAVAALGIIHLLSLCPSCVMPASLYWQHLLGPVSLLSLTLWHWLIGPIPVLPALLLILGVVTAEVCVEIREVKNYPDIHRVAVNMEETGL